MGLERSGDGEWLWVAGEVCMGRRGGQRRRARGRVREARYEGLARASKGMRGIIGHARDQQDQRDHMASRGVDGGGEGPGAGGDAWT